MSDIRSPAHWFINGWKEMCAVAPNRRSAAEKLSDLEKERIKAALEIAEGSTAGEALKNFIDESKSDSQRISRTLGAMTLVDEIFGLVHPRTPTTPLASIRIPDWLLESADSRIAEGSYWTCGSLRLIARGPLTRRERPLDASSADFLPDRFSALAVANTQTSHGSRPIKVSHKVISSSTIHGVSPGIKTGSEKVAFLAVGQDTNDLVVTGRRIGDRRFVEYRPHASLDVAKRILDGLKIACDSDICIAPELMVCEDHAEALADGLRRDSSSVRLVIAGSGNTHACDAQGMPWNEARIVNGAGFTLWRQRKIWPASISAETAKKLGLELDDDRNHFELNACGDCIEVVDIDGLGRCVVFICQDLHASPAATEIIEQFQPDWVFAPILDRNVDAGRWAHQKSITYASISCARYILATSTSYALKLGDGPDVTIGLAIGPTDEGRLCAPLTVRYTGSIGFAEVSWGSNCGAWRKWQIELSPILPH